MSDGAGKGGALLGTVMSMASALLEARMIGSRDSLTPRPLQPSEAVLSEKRRFDCGKEAERLDERGVYSLPQSR